MLCLTIQAEPQPLGSAVEIALNTGMRHGEVCALRWSDLSNDGTITVRHALGNGPDDCYQKEPKTGSSARTIPLTKHLDTMLSARRRDAERVARSASRWTSSRRCSPPQMRKRKRQDMGVLRLVWRFVRWLFRAVSRWM